MSVDAILREIEALSATEQAELLGRLSERFAPDEGAEPAPALKAELERRVAAADADPGVGIPWEVVYAESLKEGTPVSVPVVLRPDVRQEYDDAFDYYETQQSGLGVAFADRVREVLARIGNNPKAHAAVLGDVRKAVVTKFPYCVYYREVNGVVEILAVFHASRDPSVWQSRV